MQKEIWICLVHNKNGTPSTVSYDGYSTYERAVEAINRRTQLEGAWQDDFNYIDSRHRYEIKCISLIE